MDACKLWRYFNGTTKLAFGEKKVKKKLLEKNGNLAGNVVMSCNKFLLKFCHALVLLSTTKQNFSFFEFVFKIKTDLGKCDWNFLSSIPNCHMTAATVFLPGVDIWRTLQNKIVLKCNNITMHTLWHRLCLIGISGQVFYSWTHFVYKKKHNFFL